jgi:RNA polymerase sigma-70 factor (ECF subfamily)
MDAPVQATTMSGPAIVASEFGDERPTFAQVYEEQFAFVWRTARRLGTPDANLDDVAQESFVVVHQQLAKFEGRSSVKTWVYGIVRNVVRAHRRMLQAKHPHSLWPGVGPDPDSLSDASDGQRAGPTQAEAVRLVDRWLEALDDDKREVFVLAELEEMSAPEIERALGVPLNTVYSRLRLARQEFAAAAARHRARDEWRTR